MTKKARYQVVVQPLSTFLLKFKHALTTEINLTPKDIVFGAASGAALDFYAFGYKLPLGTILGVISSVIDIKISKTINFEPAKDKSKLSYLAKAYKKDILQKQQ